jgi:hypothetical protein
MEDASGHTVINVILAIVVFSQFRGFLEATLADYISGLLSKGKQ